MMGDFYGQGPKMYCACSFYEEVSNPNAWHNCPICKLKPLTWTFDNGRYTACGCGNNYYDHHTVQAESINSVAWRSDTGTNSSEYDIDELRKNWNHWCETGEFLFDPKKSFIYAIVEKDEKFLIKKDRYAKGITENKYGEIGINFFRSEEEAENKLFD